MATSYISQAQTYQAPARAGADPKKYLGSANARGYICNNSGAVFRQSLLVVSNCSHLLKLRIRAHLANMIKLRRRPHVEIRLRKKVSALWNSRNSWVMRDLSDWLTTDLWPLPHFSRQDSSPSFSNTSTCPILKNEAFLESLQHGQCGIAKIWDPTPLEFEIFQLSPPLFPPFGSSDLVPPRFRQLLLVWLWKFRHFWNAYTLTSATLQKFRAPPH